MTIHIGNKHFSEPIGIVINCMRPNILQNPHVIGRDGNRDEVCDRYEAEFQEAMRRDTDIRMEIIRIYRLAKAGNDITLMCCCVPRNRCHCMTIKSFLDKYLEGG